MQASSVTIGVGSDADGVYFRVGFGDHYALLGGVEGCAAGVQDFPGFGVGHLAVLPGGDYYRAYCFRGRGRRYSVG